jgi:hypothetical protein
MKVQYWEEMANHSGPKSCVAHREVWGEALTGETGRPAIEPRNQEIGMSTELSRSEDNTEHGVTRQSCFDPARSETLRMSGNDWHGSWEISSVPTPRGVGGTGKAQSHNPVVHADEKSDTPIVPKKPPNNGGDPAEMVEGRGVAKGNVNKNPASRTQSRNSCASMGLEGGLVVARREKAVRFTALLHHITPQLLVESFYGPIRKKININMAES